ncbi:MAG: GNAT family N-acetyltransferase [Streptosporangiales bacterium]|nr:GNAT family N-acetyltransferase [Streptosporangiales bacterium]
MRLRSGGVASKIGDMRPPERIVLDPDLLLRRLTPEDASAAHRAVAESFEILHPWMPWAAEWPKPADQEAFVASSISEWESGTSYVYGIFDAGDAAWVGTVGLHARVGPGAFEIGYWLHTDHTGKGMATRAARALSEVALALPGVDRVEIRCDEANTSSRAIPERLGFRLDRIEEHTPDAPGESGRRMIWIKDET